MEIKMKIKDIVKISDLNGTTIFEIDFQETPNDYRIKRINQLMKKYSKEKGYVWDENTDIWRKIQFIFIKHHLEIARYHITEARKILTRGDG